MPLLNNIAAWIMKKRIHQIELFMKYPYNVQEEWLMKLLETSKDTEWGKLHNYKKIKNHIQFSQRVPLQNYDSIIPYVDRLRKGEQNLLWPEEIKWFAKSAGTTSEGRKLIPISPTSLDGCHYNGGRDMVAIHCNNHPETKLFTGKNLALGGTQQKEYFGDYESFIGDVSAIVISNLPMWAEYFRAPEVEIALIGEWEEKIEKMARATMNESVTSIAGVPCWMLILFKKVLELKNASKIYDVWPNLEVYFHGGMNFSPYKKQFENLFRHLNISYLQLYNATEGFFGIQFDKNSEELLLMLDYGIYYEFIPFENVEAKNPMTVSLDEIETGKEYELVISTTAGLWRYRLGDVVQFTEKSPFKFIITGRTKQCLNVFGEKLMVMHTEKAVSQVANEFNCTISDFLVTTDFENKCHEWFIELDSESFDKQKFIETLDKKIQEINLDYKIKREKNLILNLPKVNFLQEKTFYNWLKRNDRLGGQFKVPRMVTSKILTEELKAIPNFRKN
ncbi:MAG: GH3 auxin-responsive promoter family protein [Bacteroidota bacterium]